MTDVEQQLTDHLRRRAAAAVPRYDLDAVLRRSPSVPVAEVDGHPADRAQQLEARRRPARRRLGPRLAAVAAALALVVAGTAVLLRRDPAPDQASSAADPVTSDLLEVLRPGSAVALPAAPLTSRSDPAVAWTGSELLVWGGRNDAGALHDGAAFDPATGTWREIAPWPLEPRLLPQVAWTGSELLVVDGFPPRGNHRHLRDGAAYDPVSDTWRLLPDVPIEPGDGPRYSVWTGTELVVRGDAYAAYDPATDAWRRLPRPPAEDLSSATSMVWTGEVLLVAGAQRSLARYDPRTDDWLVVDDSEGYAALLVVPGDGGEGSVLALPQALGEVVGVLDRVGDPVGSLPGIPVEPVRVGQHLSDVRAAVVGASALFELPRSGEGAPARDPWILDPQLRSWRHPGVGAPPSGAQLVPVPSLGVLLGWGPAAGGQPPTAIAYREP